MKLDDLIGSIIEIPQDEEIDLKTWLPEQVEKLVKPDVAVLDLVDPRIVNKSRGQMVFDF